MPSLLAHNIWGFLWLFFSWLTELVWRSLWDGFESIRRYNFATNFPLGSSRVDPVIHGNSRSELPSAPSPANQLPRLYPLHPVGSKGNTTVDIIAVHGIETTSPRTWTAYEKDTEPRGRSFNWLKDDNMLPSVVKEARVWVFDYNSKYSKDAQTVRFDGVAATLLNSIKDRREDFESRKLVFIGSCFGGIVVAEALVTASRAEGFKKAVFDQTAGVIFLGSPLRGTKAAAFAGWKNLVYGVLGPNQESSDTLIDDLNANSSRLAKLVADFGKLTVRTRTQPGMEIRCFYETRKTQLLNAVSRKLAISATEILLVDQVSACLDCHEHIPLDVSHTKMNKFRGPEDPNFKLVSGRIKDIVDKIGTDSSWTVEERECMQALSFPYQDQKDVNPERVKGTCEWLLHHPKFLNWREETTANLLWVTAGPGCGKSVLCKALVDEGLLHPENPDTMTTSVCYFFFKDDAERGNAANALRSILHQLFKQKPWLIRHAIPEYVVNGSQLPFGTLWDILKKAATDSSAGPVVCIFDALDECEPRWRTSLIQSFSSFHRESNTTSSKLKFIVTSRPYYELEMDFGVDDLPSIHLEGNEVSEEISREVDIVINSEVSRISNARRPPLEAKIQDKVKQHLAEQENRTYLWVYLMLQELSRTLESTERRLKQLLETLPSSVDDAYEKILQRATDRSQARRVLCLILAAERPLNLKEMNIALEILDMKERGEKCTSESDLQLDKQEAFQKKIENLCGLFISIIGGKIYLIHQTAKTFLIHHSDGVSHRSSSCWKHTFTQESSHVELLKACVGYLQLEFLDVEQFTRERELYNLDEGNYPFELEDFDLYSMTDEDFNKLDQNHSLFVYASLNWRHHFQQAGKKIDRGLALEGVQLCKTESKNFLLWYRICRNFCDKRIFPRPGEDSISIVVASYFGLTTVVQLMIERKSDLDIDAKDTGDGRTALWWAAEEGHESIVKLLLNTGKVDVNSKDRDGITPLVSAANNGHDAVAKLLLDTGEVDVTVKDKWGRTPLTNAVFKGNYAVVTLLLEKGNVDVNPKDVDELSPLAWAAMNRDEAIVKLLLNTGKVDINSKDTYGLTPLGWAAGKGDDAIVKLLLNTGKVDVNSKDRDGKTPLVLAANIGHDAVARLLLNTGEVNVNVKDQWAWTLLSTGAMHRHEEVVKLLLNTGKVDVNSKDADGLTPLAYAAVNGHEAIVKLLLNTGQVEVNSEDISVSPLFLAARFGHKAVVKLLQSHLDSSQQGREITSTDFYPTSRARRALEPTRSGFYPFSSFPGALETSSADFYPTPPPRRASFP